MKKLLLGCFLFITISSSCFAALPPFYQSAKELKDLLSDQRLAEKLGSGQLIQDIIRTENGYLIVTPRKRLDVEVHYYPPKYGVGPSQYEFYFHEPVQVEFSRK